MRVLREVVESRRALASAVMPPPLSGWLPLPPFSLTVPPQPTGKKTSDARRNGRML